MKIQAAFSFVLAIHIMLFYNYLYNSKKEKRYLL